MPALDVALAISFSKWGGVWGGVVARLDFIGELADDGKRFSSDGRCISSNYLCKGEGV